MQGAKSLNLVTMEFKEGILIDRELEIAYYFRHAFSLDRIVEKTGMNKKILQGHVRNMREKLHAEDTTTLIKMIQGLSEDQASELLASATLATNSKLRETTNTYFDSEDETSKVVGKHNVVLIAIALLVSIGTVLFVCNTFLQLLTSNGFLSDFQNLFTN